MSNSTQITAPGVRHCGRCKKEFPQSQLSSLWRLPLFVLRLAHATPGDEGDWLYCRPCARSQNMGIVFLAVMFSVVIAIGGGRTLTYGLIGGWAVGLLIWAFLYLRYRLRMASFIRSIAAMSPADRNQALAQLSERDKRTLLERLTDHAA